MPNLSSAFSSVLPSLTGAIGSVSDSVVNYAMAGPNTLLQEGLAKVSSTFSSFTNPFTKLSTAFTPTAPAVATETLASAASIRASTENGDSTDDGTGHKVKLVADVSDGESTVIQNDVNFAHEPLMQRVVEFDVMPEVQEIHAAEYEPLSAPQMPLEFQKYKGTKSIQWQINGTFTCRTREEAMRNYIYLNNLRGWTKPYFGEKQRLQFGGDNGGRGKLGAPPPVLKFSGWRGLVGTVPVVITSLNWNWPKDCDWIPTGVKDDEGKEIPFPTVMQVNISLVESFSPDQVNGFDLVQFRNGRMVNAWLPYGEEPPAPDVSEALGDNGGNQSAIAGTAQPYAGESANYASTADYSNEGRQSIVTVEDSLSPGETVVAPRIAAVDQSNSTQALITQGVPGTGSGAAPIQTTTDQISKLTTVRSQFVELRTGYVSALKGTVADASALVSQGLGGSPEYERLTKVQFPSITASIDSVDKSILTIDDKLSKLKGTNG